MLCLLESQAIDKRNLLDEFSDSELATMSNILHLLWKRETETGWTRYSTEVWSCCIKSACVVTLLSVSRLLLGVMDRWQDLDIDDRSASKYQCCSQNTLITVFEGSLKQSLMRYVLLGQRFYYTQQGQLGVGKRHNQKSLLTGIQIKLFHNI